VIAGTMRSPSIAIFSVSPLRTVTHSRSTVSLRYLPGVGGEGE
jgi:hypothetical protein